MPISNSAQYLGFYMGPGAGHLSNDLSLGIRLLRDSMQAAMIGTARSTVHNIDGCGKRLISATPLSRLRLGNGTLPGGTPSPSF